MTAVSPAVQNDSVVAAPNRSLHHMLGVVWLVFFFSDIYLPLDQLSPVPIFYLVAGSAVFYFALARPLHVVAFASQPIAWLWALTAVTPLAIYSLGGASNPFAWPEAVVRVTYFAAFAGAGVFLLGSEGPGIIRTAARIALVIAVTTNLADLAWDNPYNSAEGSGRTAGFYGDANRAAAAIGTLLVLSVDISKQSLKGLFIAGISILAIIATQSRSGMIFGAFLAAGYIFLPRGPGTFSVPARVGLAFTGALLVVVLVITAYLTLSFDFEQTWRVRSLIGLDVSDGSVEDRLDAAGIAMESFTKNFWTGYGLGGSQYYGFAPHNTYLEIALQYGVGGLLLYLLLIGHAVFKTSQLGLKIALTQALVIFQIVYYGFFSHTVQTSPIFGIVFAAVIANALVRDSDHAGESTAPS